MYGSIGPYKLIGILGRGGMGVVYKGYETSLNRSVAIKVLSPAMADDESVKERFLREARSMAALNDPHIIQIYFIGENEGQPYFAMEFVEGESLGSLLSRDGKLKPEQAAKIIYQTALGLSAAHEKGVVHRDIKPGNLMVSKRGGVKIADFGIALSARDLTSKLTTTGEFVGTPGYLSPEVCQGKPVDERSDIFSLGIVLFECLAGRLPFTDDSPLGLMLEVVKAEVPNVMALNRDVDPQLSGILARMVAKDPKDRFQSCAELADALARHPLVQQTGPLVVDARNPKLAPIVRVPTMRAPVPPAAIAVSTSGITRIAQPENRARQSAPLKVAAFAAALAALSGLAWYQYSASASSKRQTGTVAPSVAQPAAEGSFQTSAEKGDVAVANEPVATGSAVTPALLDNMWLSDIPDDLFDTAENGSDSDQFPLTPNAPLMATFYPPSLYVPPPAYFVAVPWRAGIGFHIGIGYWAARVVAQEPVWFAPPLLVRPVVVSLPPRAVGGILASASPPLLGARLPALSANGSTRSFSPVQNWQVTTPAASRPINPISEARFRSSPSSVTPANAIAKPIATVSASTQLTRRPPVMARAATRSTIEVPQHSPNPRAGARIANAANRQSAPRPAAARKSLVERPRERRRGQ
ncbi:MAG: protein kinase [Acidobacteriaceae bacterium]|nr:protein kinase [Acidobacteriaceae bacterium]